MKTTQIVLFEDLVAVKIDNRGKTPPITSSGYPLLEINSISSDRLYPDLSKVSKYVDQDTYNTWFRQHLEKDDILFTTVGTIAESAIIPKSSNATVAQNILGFRFDNTLVDPLFALYLMRSKWFINQIAGRTIETVQKSIKWSDMRKIKINLPDLEIQKKIGDILGTIDEKIELNRKINETLEQIGQTLFRHYFIDNPEAEKWERKPLGDFVDLVNGVSYKSSELQPSLNALVTLKSVGRGGGFSQKGYKEFTGKMKNAQIVHDGDLIVAHTDLTQKAEVAGYPAFVDGTDRYEQVAISMDLVKVAPLSREVSSSFVYFLLMTREFQNYKMGFINGSTVLHLNKKCIPSYEIALPSDKDTLQQISSNFDGLMEKIKVNNQEIHTLTTTRETLLPRLISGKVKL